MKEMVRAIFAPSLSVETVSGLIDRLLARLSRSRLKPFVRLGRTIRKHREGILAARRLKLSNARAEALNNKVKLIVRVCHVAACKRRCVVASPFFAAQLCS